MEKITDCLFAFAFDAVPAVISLDMKNHHASVFSLGDFLTQNFISFQGWMMEGEKGLTGRHKRRPDDGASRGDNSFIGQPITGLDIDENTGDILIRSCHGLIWTNRQGMNRCFSSVDGSDPDGVSAGVDAIYALAPKGRRIDMIKTDGRPGGSAFLVGALH